MRNRAVRLLTEYFQSSGPNERRAIFAAALGDCASKPCAQIEFEGAAAVFAGHAVDKLLELGPTGRGQHHLALLIRHLATARGKQSHPDFVDLPRELNKSCTLPTREEELR
ncbi:MAG: hypothetical protein ABL931_20340, partial [Usitatibacteraceae bacterium]